MQLGIDPLVVRGGVISASLARFAGAMGLRLRRPRSSSFRRAVLISICLICLYFLQPDLFPRLQDALWGSPNCPSRLIDPFNLESINSQLHVSEKLSDGDVERLKGWWTSQLPGLRTDAPHEKDARGIVISPESGPQGGRRAAALIVLLRLLGCSLPVEVWFLHRHPQHTDDDHDLAEVLLRREIDAVIRWKGGGISPEPVYFRSFGLNSTRAAAVVNPHSTGPKKAYLVKPAAILNSRFQQLLWLDADVLPLADPTPLFESGEFKKTGAVFWPDYWRTPTRSRLWEIFGTECRNEWEFESGIILLDKARPAVVRALWLVWWLNAHGWRPPLDLSKLALWKAANGGGGDDPRMDGRVEAWYDLFLGDKDTFRFAFSGLGVAYHLVEHWVAPVGIPGLIADDVSDGSTKLDLENNKARRRGFCAHSMLQHSPSGAPLFLHANLLKYTENLDSFSYRCIPSDNSTQPDPRTHFLLPWTSYLKVARTSPPSRDELDAHDADPGGYAVHPGSPLLARTRFKYPAPGVWVTPPSLSCPPGFKPSPNFNAFKFGLCMDIESVGSGWEVRTERLEAREVRGVWRGVW